MELQFLTGFKKIFIYQILLIFF